MLLGESMGPVGNPEKSTSIALAFETPPRSDDGRPSERASGRNPDSLALMAPQKTVAKDDADAGCKTGE